MAQRVEESALFVYNRNVRAAASKFSAKTVDVGSLMKYGVSIRQRRRNSEEMEVERARRCNGRQ